MNPFTCQRGQSVASLGETGLIAEIRRWLGSATPKAPVGIGDDCAMVPDILHDQLVTVDPVIYGEHFDHRVPAKGAGAKLFHRNLSDIAAMGGRPRAAVVALALSETVKIEWLCDFYRSLGKIARRHEVAILGGDIAHQPTGLCATMTLLGEAVRDRVLTRTGAKARDWIFVTGRLGGSLQGWHWQFSPRLDEGQWLASREDVRSMIDISDGLAKDLRALTPPGCRAALRSSAIPVSHSAKLVSRQSQRPALAHALGDGEDYELLFTVNSQTNPARFLQAWHQQFPRLPLSCVGRFVKTRAPSDGDDELTLSDYHGFEHLH